MCLSSSNDSDTVRTLGETEASSAGEQLAEGYPSRAMTDLRQGRPPGLPAPFPPSVIGRPCLQKLPPEGRNGWPTGRSEKVVRISGKMWSNFPERAKPSLLLLYNHRCLFLLSPVHRVSTKGFSASAHSHPPLAGCLAQSRFPDRRFRALGWQHAGALNLNIR